MDVHIAPDLEEKLEQRAAQQGRDAQELAQEALARYFADEARYLETVEVWTEAQWMAAMSQVEDGFLESTRGNSIDTVQARREIQEFKHDWLKRRRRLEKK